MSALYLLHKHPSNQAENTGITTVLVLQLEAKEHQSTTMSLVSLRLPSRSVFRTVIDNCLRST